MKSVSLSLYSDALTAGKHPNINVKTQIPLELCYKYGMYIWVLS